MHIVFCQELRTYICLFLSSYLSLVVVKADVEVTFDLPVLEGNPEVLDSDHVDDAVLFDRDSSVGCVYGPFGLLALASDDLREQTAIFFKIILRGNGYSVVMGSDEKKYDFNYNLETRNQVFIYLM